MLHVKYQDHRISGSEEEDFFFFFTIHGHVGHLGHGTCTIYINFLSNFPRRIHKKYGIDWPVGLREENV